jgi:hypothetical protein
VTHLKIDTPDQISVWMVHQLGRNSHHKTERLSGVQFFELDDEGFFFLEHEIQEFIVIRGVQSISGLCLQNKKSTSQFYRQM